MNSIRSRAVRMRAYVELQIYNVVANEWVRIALAPIFFSLGGVVVILWYIPLKHSEVIPGSISAGFSYLGVAMAAVVIWTATDALGTTRTSESVLLELQARPTSRPQLVWLRQTGLLKRARALRPVAHPIGSFGNITLSVPVVFLEEIFNQLLFLLSL